MEKLKVRVDFGKYKYVTLPVNDALQLIDSISESIGEVNDIKEVRRILQNFNVFYETAKRKFKDYLIIPHTPSDMIRGNVVVDKVKLFKDADADMATIVFDRRVDLNLIVEHLRKIGYTVEVVKESL